MTSNARAQRLIDEFKEGAAFAGGHSVRHGIAAVLRHLVDTEAVSGWISIATLQQCADALTAPTLLDRAMAGDRQAARRFLRESGFTDANGNLLPQFQSPQEQLDD